MLRQVGIGGKGSPLRKKEGGQLVVVQCPTDASAVGIVHRDLPPSVFRVLCGGSWGGDPGIMHSDLL